MRRPAVVTALSLGLVVATACAPAATTPGTREGERLRMVEEQIAGRGIRNPAVLDAMRRVPRHLFVPGNQQRRAYDDTPLPIGLGQTISQPYIVAYMTEALEPRPTDRVLEIGTGSGYQAAVLAELVAELYTIEIVPELAGRAKATLDAQGYRNIHTWVGDGYAGWPDAAPFDRIILTAAPEEIPGALVDQLALGGLLIAPVGRGDQMMTIVRKTPGGLVTRRTMPVRFVPMVKGQ